MEIEIEKCIQIFKEEVSKYDLNNYQLNQRYQHTFRVMSNAEWLAKQLNLKKEKIKLAKLIALLHDYGRFYQINTTSSLSDKQLDHAKFGIKLLFEDNRIEKYVTDKEIQKTIYYAILNHNKLTIDTKDMTSEQILFSKIIRDSDKIDILYLNGEDKKLLDFEVEQVSKKVSEDCKTRKMIQYKDIKTNGDKVIVQLCRIYDMNFNISLKKVKEEKLLEKIYNKLQKKELVKEYFVIIEKYIEERLKEDQLC